MTLTLMGAGPETATTVFTPASLSPTAWFQADSGTSTTTDAAAISQWNDLSGNNNHLVQATGTKQPLYKTAIQNSKPAVRFDGVDDFLNVAFTLVEPASIFVVGAWRAVAVTTIVSGNVAQNYGALFQGTSVAVTAYGGTSNVTLTTTPLSWHVLGAEFNGASSALRADGGTAATGNDGGSSTGIAGLTAGAGTQGTNQFASADVGEILVFNSVLSAGNRQAVEAYLKGRWGTP